MIYFLSFEKNDRSINKMNKLNKKTKTIIIAAVIAVVAIIVCISHFKKPGRIDGFESTVTSIDNIRIPEGTRIVALGEATHGNREFQELKLDVLKVLVENSNVRSLVLEGDFGGCCLVNDYIQGGEGDPKELVNHLGYRIYRTQQMYDLIEWMRQYNETAEDGDKIRLYGMDIQKDTDDKVYIENLYERLDAGKYADYSARMDTLLGDSYDTYDASKYDEIIALMDEIEGDLTDNFDAYAGITSNEEVQRARIAAGVIRYFMDLELNTTNYHKFRDTAMKELVDRILALEEKEYGSAIMIGCHNGHMTENNSSNFTYLGSFLNESYGDSYFTIGTDYYYTSDNLPGTSGRTVERFCSDDPLAYQVGSMPENRYYIDFSTVDPNSAVGKMINRSISTGSLGEDYNITYKFVKAYHQLNYAPTDMYDAMILYYEVNPTEIWE